MGLFKRGKYWNYDFCFRNIRHQGSTRLRNHEQAKLWLSTFRTKLAFEPLGVTPKDPAPVLSVFLKGPFTEYVKQHAQTENTKLSYLDRIKSLCLYAPFTTLTLDQIDELALQGFKEAKLRDQLSVCTINSDLRILRKALGLAEESRLIARIPKMRRLPGEVNRVFVLSGELEVIYLAKAQYPLREVAILMLDLGLRPAEAVALKWSDITEASVSIHHGKSVNAKRVLPQTARTKLAFKNIAAFELSKTWVFPGMKDQHMSAGSLTTAHIRLRNANDWPKEFVLYSLRHTYGTRLAESGASAFVIKSAMGHSSVKISERYIHPTDEHLSVALKRKELLDRLMRGEAIHTEPPIRESVDQSR